MSILCWNDLYPPSLSAASERPDQQRLLEAVLVPAFGGLILEYQKSFRSKFFAGATRDLCLKYAQQFLQESICAATGEPYTYGQFPPWVQANACWQQLVQSLSASQRQAFSKKIDALLHRLESKNSSSLLRVLANAVQTEPELCARLASLSIAATTAYLWKDSKEPRFTRQAEHLCLLILPASAAALADDTDEEAARRRQQTDEQAARQLLQKANALMQQYRYNEAGSVCEQVIFDHCFAPDILLGKAYYLLACCCDASASSHKLPAGYNSAQELLHQAQIYGYNYAEETAHTILPALNAAQQPTQGTCICNAENPRCDYLQATKPAGWQMISCARPETQLRPNARQYFLLLSDDLEKNVQDAVRILGTIQQSSTLADSWQNTRLYLRCKEESAAPLLDTALSFLRTDKQECPVQVFLLDDAKRTAQQLFARHPLFYPLQLSAEQNRRTDGALRLVILSDSADISLAAWLVREAFWLLPISGSDNGTRITVLSPQADAIRDHIGCVCPGLAPFFTSVRSSSRSEAINISDIDFPQIEFISISFDSPALVAQLEKIESSQDLLYYVIHTDSDLDTIALGTTVRRQNIRSAVLHGHIGRYSHSRAVVALHCTTPEYTRLAQDLLVPKESEHGNQWFNSYNFVAFGGLDTLYTWQTLDGGILETIAQCVHLQYCGVAAGDASYTEALSSYFSRLYNRDSSLCCAVSLPYRLFCAGVTALNWFIQDSDAYWGKSQRDALAEQFHFVLYQNDLDPRPSVLLQMGKYEHTRWACYMLSRGWLPTDQPGRAEEIIRAGAPRHMLQIAQLHPCICSWEELKTLHRVLDWAYRSGSVTSKEDKYDPRFERYRAEGEEYTYFTDVDLVNICMTPALLRTEWFT